ncbi:riboflavin synthase [bacterium]|nr:riboflavin synthase [bacterium]
MFTGLTSEVGAIQKIRPQSGIVNLTLYAPKLSATGVKFGDSIAMNGICLTVVELHAKGFTVQVMQETVKHTTLGNWQVGDAINLERALTFADRLDGHLVNGHVDGTAIIHDIRKEGAAQQVVLSATNDVHRYIAKKGSVAIDGVSLTVSEIAEANRFTVALIPHTLVETNLQFLKPGKRVNVEVDIIARYLERLTQSTTRSGLTLEKLREYGF